MSAKKESVDGKFHIHGDNIVEYERTFKLIRDSLADLIQAVTPPLTSAVCPIFVITLKDDWGTLTFTFLPGYGRWNKDILSLVRDRGGPLREAADAIITEVAPVADIPDAIETPLLAIEYCGALPAGNQAWQRSGRAYSFGLAKIPYIYVAELGGFELGGDRVKKAARLPNPAIPFSFLSFSFSVSTPVMPVFTANVGSSPEMQASYQTIFGDIDLLQLLRAIFLVTDVKEAYRALADKVMALVVALASAKSEKSKNDSLTVEQWRQAYAHIAVGGSLPVYLSNNAPLDWKKTAYIDGLTVTAKGMMNLAAKYAIGLTSKTLPMCIIPPDRRQAFADEVEALYGALPTEFKIWLSRNSPLTICWVMGFKPKGDDARPDRGLPPLTRMLIGNNSDLMTFVYGPAPASTWTVLHSDPGNLMTQNGLWESALSVSDALLLDSSTMDGSAQRAYQGSHWQTPLTATTPSSLLVTPMPTHFGEHDVDTAIHLLLAHFGGGDVFEGLCNPPGGDWSGISLRIPERQMEVRWLSLPRVSGASAKRPDHIFQIFGLSEKPMILIIESKERAANVESFIGVRLTQYVSGLMGAPPNVLKSDTDNVWQENLVTFDRNRVQFISAAAFLLNRDAELQEVNGCAGADIILGFQFESTNGTCHIKTLATSDAGKLTLSVLIAAAQRSGGIIVIEDVTGQ